MAERCELSERPKRLKRWVGSVASKAPNLQHPQNILLKGSTSAQKGCVWTERSIHHPSHRNGHLWSQQGHFLSGCDSEDLKRGQATVTLLLGNCKDDVYQWVYHKKPCCLSLRMEDALDSWKTPKPTSACTALSVHKTWSSSVSVPEWHCPETRGVRKQQNLYKHLQSDTWKQNMLWMEQWSWIFIFVLRQ